MEDALLNQAQQRVEAVNQIGAMQEQLQQAAEVIVRAAEDNAAYHNLLTNPELLAEYVTKLFAPDGPYPTELPQDRLAAEVAMNEEYGQRWSAPTAYERPQLDIPAPGVQNGSGTGDFYSTFSQLMDTNPVAAAQYLSTYGTPDALRSKMLISEG